MSLARLVVAAIAATCSACSTPTLVQRPERTPRLIVSVDGGVAADTIPFQVHTQPFPNPPVMSLEAGGSMWTAATSGVPDTPILPFIFYNRVGVPLFPMIVPAFVRPTVAEAISANAFQPSPTEPTQPGQAIGLAFLYFEGVGTAPTDSTVLTYVSGDFSARFVIPQKPLVQPSLVAQPPTLRVPRTGVHDYHFRLEGYVPRDSSTVALLISKQDPSYWLASVLSWADTRTWKQYPAEKMTEWRLYFLELPEAWRGIHYDR